MGGASNIGFRSTPNLQTLRQDGTAIRAKATAASNASWATPEGSTCQLSSRVTRSARVERRRRPAAPSSGWRSSGPRNRARGDGTCRSRASARCLLSLRKRHKTRLVPAGTRDESARQSFSLADEKGAPNGVSKGALTGLSRWKASPPWGLAGALTCAGQKTGAPHATSETGQPGFSSLEGGHIAGNRVVNMGCQRFSEGRADVRRNTWTGLKFRRVLAHQAECRSRPKPARASSNAWVAERETSGSLGNRRDRWFKLQKVKSPGECSYGERRL